MRLVYAVDKKTNKSQALYWEKDKNTLNQIIKKLINADRFSEFQYLIRKEIHSTQRSGERFNLTIRIHLKRFNRRGICMIKNRIILKAILKIYFWA